MNAMPRFLYYEILGQLCRYLRATGYDALLNAIQDVYASKEVTVA